MQACVDNSVCVWVFVCIGVVVIDDRMPHVCVVCVDDRSPGNRRLVCVS